MIAAIYCRVSTDDQDIQQQQDLLIDFALKKNYEYRSYMDYAISGKVSDRPAWQRLLRHCEAGKFDLIIVAKYDRITRDLEYAIQFLKWLEIHPEVGLSSIYDGTFEFSPDQIFNFKLKCLLSEYELQQLKWRSRIGIERAKKEGKYKGRKHGSKNKTKI